MVKVRTGRSGLFLHERDDRGGVDASGEERTERHIGDHPRPDRPAEQVVHLVEVLALGRRVHGTLAAGSTGLDHRFERPPHGLCRSSVRAERHDGPRPNLSDTGMDAPAGREVPVAQEGCDG
jgi:hypothetical protein